MEVFCVGIFCPTLNVVSRQELVKTFSFPNSYKYLFKTIEPAKINNLFIIFLTIEHRCKKQQRIRKKIL